MAAVVDSDMNGKRTNFIVRPFLLTFVVSIRKKRPSHKGTVFSKQFSFGCADYASSAKYLIVLTICDV